MDASSEAFKYLEKFDMYCQIKGIDQVDRIRKYPPFPYSKKSDK